MRITPLHYAALAATLGRLHSSITVDTLAAIIGPDGVAEYGFLGALTEDDARVVQVPPLRRIALNAIRSLTESTPVCPAGAGLPGGHGLALERVPNTAEWRQVTNCPICGTYLRAPERGARVYDWIAGREVDPDVTHHVAPGLRVPLDLAELARMLGAPLDPQIERAALEEGIPLPHMLHILLTQRCNGDVRALLANLGAVPLAWSVQDGLRVAARQGAPRAAVEARPAAPQGFDFDTVYNAALEADLADPNRRDMLMEWIPKPVVGSLQRYPRPADQIRSDMRTLASFPDDRGMPYLVVWLENAAKLTRPRLAARIFDAARSALEAKSTIRVGEVAGGVGVVVEAGQSQGISITMDRVSGPGTIGVVLKGR